MGLRDVTGDGKHHGQGVLGGGDCVGGGGVHNDDAVAGGGFDVDVVVAHPGAANDLEFLGSRQYAGRDLRLAADDEAVVVADGGDQLIFFEAKARVGINAALTKNLRAIRRDGVCDEDAHGHLRSCRCGGETDLLQSLAKDFKRLVKLFVRHVAQVADAEDGV